MDKIDPICTVISIIINLVEKIETTKANKERCQRIAQRVRHLEEMILTIKQRDPDQISSIVCKTLNELWYSVISAKDLIEKFSKTKNFKSFVMSKTHEEQFCKVNERLTENLQSLSGALHIEQGHILREVHKSLYRQESLSSSTPLPPPTPSAPTSAPTPSAPPLMPSPPTRAPTPFAPMAFPMPAPPGPFHIPMAPFPPTVTRTVYRTAVPPVYRYAAHSVSPMPFVQSVPLSPPILTNVAPVVAPLTLARPVTIITVQQQQAPSLVNKLFN